MSPKKEYGDFQTPDVLAEKVVSVVDKLFGSPKLVIEPTAGLGAFLQAASDHWGDHTDCVGYEINLMYVELAQARLAKRRVLVHQCDFFLEDWKKNLVDPEDRRLLVLGNPPWVTNSKIGQMQGTNLPPKSNFLGLRGFDAQTGKSNFDIAEWMLIRLLEGLPASGAMAMLCKTATARKVLHYFWKNGEGREGTRLFTIDAKAHFDVAVDACLFFVTGVRTTDRVALVYPDLDVFSTPTRFGFIDDNMVSDIDSYQAHRGLDGGSSLYTWRSGIKHDASAIMEFTRPGDQLHNGLGERVNIEPDYVYPLLKSSDLGNGRTAIRKYVLVTQEHTGEDTIQIKNAAPQTWKYLIQHGDALDSRKSSIYKGRPRFSVFGVGPYSFSPWKVAISGFYKTISFVVVPPCDGSPVMVDDTCYFISCYSQSEAELLYSLLTTDEAKAFLSSLVFTDSKRPITIDVLRRLSIVELARACGKLVDLQQYAIVEKTDYVSLSQTMLVMERQAGYQTSSFARIARSQTSRIPKRSC